MKFATQNVNSIRTRIDRVIAFLERSGVDVLAMQEIKCTPERFPIKPFTVAGYEVVIRGLNQWNGVAIASRLPVVKIQDHFVDRPGFGESKVMEARAFGITLRGKNKKETRIWSLYVPNGRGLDRPHYTYKLGWLRKFRSDAQSWLAVDPKARIAVVDDWNVVPSDKDVWDMNAFDRTTHVPEPERQAFFAFAEDRWTEVTRDHVTNYAFWNYQRLRFPKNKGMCINFVYTSPTLAPSVSAARIDRDECKGKGASDHAPVTITLKD